ncbi:hypothetical protein QRX50_04465 [Amycolatopsis carbonis]|uniref:MFS transporter n=1 Tax=Amycolatopsis carbonis TaxID=715471 RepID=A0A9Y2IKL0_9PSEU|nr:hypothetical protein [Amycolatopsis sp. 2-15]WIX80053.1 hypothetical protein QRX50_04465 [Amycolatopsis sp. 2-15]
MWTASARVIAVAGIAGCAAATVPVVFAGASMSFVVRGRALSVADIAITPAFTWLPREDVPSGSAVVRLVHQLGGSAGTAVLASIAASGAFRPAFLLSGVLAFVALFPAFFLGRRKIVAAAR